MIAIPIPQQSVAVSSEYVHDQGVPSLTWTIEHNLGKHPNVRVVDSGGHLIYGNVEYVSANVVVLTFDVLFSGAAYLD